MKPITSDQKEQVGNFAKGAARKGAEEAVEELLKNGVLNGDNIQRIIESKQFSADIREYVKQKLIDLAEVISGRLKLISGAETITLKPTDGKDTIAKVPEAFNWYIDPDFENYGTNVPSDPTKETAVSVYEMIKDGDYARIFGSLSDDLDKLCLTQPQIIQFVKNHRKWLRTDGYATFFLFKVKNEYFVAHVGRLNSDGRLKVGVFRFSDDGAWFADYRLRIVVPQLALAN